MTPFIKRVTYKFLFPSVNVAYLSNTVLCRSLLFIIAISITLAACKKDDEIKPGSQPLPHPQVKVTANAGTDQSVKAGQSVTLDGSASKDNKGTTLTYNWLFTNKPAGSTAMLTNATEVKPVFTADLAGAYEIELTVSNTNGQARDKVLITVTPVDLITLSNEINADLLLENINPDPAKADYLVTADIVVRAKLTVKPGVVVEFENNKGLHIYPQGTLIAQGTEAERIVFTGKEKTAGFWKGILLESNNLLNELDYAAVEFGGSSPFSDILPNVKANVALAGYDVSASSLKVSHTLFAFSGGYGLFVQGNSELNGFSANIFSKNTASPLFLPVNQVHKLDAASFYSGNNGYEGVEISGTLYRASEVTWPKLGLGSRYFVSSDITVQSGVKIAEGATFEFKEGLVLRVTEGGYLNASGSADNKITFTARTRTGELNWGGIFFNTNHDQNKLLYTEVSYAGNKDIPELGTFKTNVAIGTNGKAAVQQSTISNGLGWGIVAFTNLGANINMDVATVNNFSNLAKGQIKLTSVEVPTVQLAGEWLDEWSFSRGYTTDDKFYDRQANRWFRGAADPWEMNPKAGFGLKISENGNYIWTIAEYGPWAGCGNPYSAEYITGNVTASGKLLTFQENYWRSKFYNPCDVSQSVDTDVQPGGMTLRYETTQLHNAVTGETYWKLTIFNPDNSSFNYFKK